MDVAVVPSISTTPSQNLQQTVQIRKRARSVPAEIRSGVDVAAVPSISPTPSQKFKQSVQFPLVGTQHPRLRDRERFGPVFSYTPAEVNASCRRRAIDLKRHKKLRPITPQIKEGSATPGPDSLGLEDQRQRSFRFRHGLEEPDYFTEREIEELRRGRERRRHDQIRFLREGHSPTRGDLWLQGRCVRCAKVLVKGIKHHCPVLKWQKDKRKIPGLTLPCLNCRSPEHSADACWQLHAKCEKCGHRGHMGIRCEDRTLKDWLNHFLSHFHLGVFTRDPEGGVINGNMGFGDISELEPLDARLQLDIDRAEFEVRFRARYDDRDDLDD